MKILFLSSTKFTWRLTALIFVLLAYSASSFGQVPDKDIVWQKSYGGTSEDVGRYIHKCSDGNYLLVCGTTSLDGDVTGYNGGTSDYWVVKINTSGTIIWQKALGGSDYDLPVIAKETYDGNYIIAGTTWSNDGDVSTNKGQSDVWLVLLNSSGGIVWQKTYGGSDIDQAADIIPTNDSGFIISATTFSNDGDVSVNKGGYDCWVFKIDKAGAIEWEKSFGGSSSDQAKNIIQTSDTGLILSGLTYSNDGDVSMNKGNFDFWITKIDKNRNIVWSKTYGSPGNDRLNSMIECSNGDYIAIGYISSAGGDITNFYGSEDIWIIRISASGSLIWQKNYGGSFPEQGNSITRTSDEGFLVTGWTTSQDGDLSSPNADGNQWVYKINANGTIVWQKVLGSDSVDLANYGLQTADGGYLITGVATSNSGDVLTNQTGNAGISDVWLYKLHSATSIDDEIQSAELAYNVFPTVSKGIFYIESLSGNGTVSNDIDIRLFSITGSQVNVSKTYKNTQLQISTISEIPTGIYILKIANEMHKIVIKH